MTRDDRTQTQDSESTEELRDQHDVEDTLDTEQIEEIDEFQQLQHERDDYLDQLQRSRAEFVNFKRRTDQERFALREVVTRDVLSQFLPVVDDFDRALSALPEEEKASSWVKGMEMVHAKFNGILERAGVTAIEALGKPFDPKEHEAVATEPGTSGSHVAEVYQNGYRIGSTLIRPAMVKTGNAPTDQTFDA